VEHLEFDIMNESPGHSEKIQSPYPAIQKNEWVKKEGSEFSSAAVATVEPIESPRKVIKMPTDT
jgi:hypothetical protein